MRDIFYSRASARVFKNPVIKKKKIDYIKKKGNLYPRARVRDTRSRTWTVINLKKFAYLPFVRIQFVRLRTFFYLLLVTVK